MSLTEQFMKAILGCVHQDILTLQGERTVIHLQLIFVDPGAKTPLSNWEGFRE